MAGGFWCARQLFDARGLTAPALSPSAPTSNSTPPTLPTESAFTTAGTAPPRIHADTFQWVHYSAARCWLSAAGALLDAINAPQFAYSALVFKKQIFLGFSIEALYSANPYY